jgi:hypothetical protein
MWPREKACRNIRQRVREAVRSIPSNGPLGVVIQKLNPILNGWCTYFRVGNSNRIFHQIDWAVLSELQLWLQRKHQRSWRSARKRWNYQFLYKRCRLYQMVGRVSHLPGLRRMPPRENRTSGSMRGCRKRATVTRLCPTLREAPWLLLVVAALRRSHETCRPDENMAARSAQLS